MNEKPAANGSKGLVKYHGKSTFTHKRSTWYKSKRYNRPPPNGKSSTAGLDAIQTEQSEQQQQQQLGLQANAGIESSCRPFAWQRQCHKDERIISPLSLPPLQFSQLKTLRELTAHKLAQMIIEYPEDLTETVLKQSMLSWEGGWKYVWDEVAGAGSDSYSMFQRFANVFGNERRFRCHGKQTYADIFGSHGKDDSSLTIDNQFQRSRCLRDRLVVSRSNHRVEHLPGLRSMGSLVTELNTRQQFKFLTLLDMGVRGTRSPQPQRQLFLDIMALPSLVALDVSGCEMVDSAVLRCWAVAMKSGQWQNLRILDLSQCSKVSNLSVFEVMKTSSSSSSSSSGTAEKGNSGLVYVMTTTELQDPLQQQIESLWRNRASLVAATKDRKPSFPRSNFSLNYGLAKKYLFLRNWYNNVSPAGGHVVVDPEASANYMRKRYLLQEFVFHDGEKPISTSGSNTTPQTFEYFRLSWPTESIKSSSSSSSSALVGSKRTSSHVNSASTVSNGRQRRQRIVSRGPPMWL